MKLDGVDPRWLLVAIGILAGSDDERRGLVQYPYVSARENATLQLPPPKAHEILDG